MMSKFDKIYKEIISESSNIVSESSEVPYSDQYTYIGYFDKIVYGTDITQIMSVFDKEDANSIEDTFYLDSHNLIFSENRYWLIYPFVDVSKKQRVKNAGINELIRVIKDVADNPKELKAKFAQVLDGYGEDINDFRSSSDLSIFLLNRVIMMKCLD